MNQLTQWCDYHDYISDNFLYVCKGKKVLEIAPLVGHQTKAIVAQAPESLTLIEPVEWCVKKLESEFPNAYIVNDDVYHVYQNQLPADVVVACGLLYHLHSPLYLLELIVNQSDPKYIIFDNIFCNTISINEEAVGELGAKQVRKNWKAVRSTLLVPFEIINNALTDLNYICLKKENLEKFNIKTKTNSWMAMWEKKPA
jgi:16S rRNA A1518/A1519 N6-dimethyltransferase RsmA/KsgA/DIM1 with predicted DNA glycosylase/AP lyase activity